ncbi:unnamed protein product [Anisakis simplex]|uniref:MFS domain-containing protein n=1 Tax=Anisakis simplex TaxID=6269 RepID=A0A0M3K1V3_ANISI|nr:unnamed protein product [Anisakis simplex]
MGKLELLIVHANKGSQKVRDVGWTTTSEIDAEKSSVSSEELPYEETHEERVRRKTLEQEDIVRKVTLAEVPQAKPRLVRRYIVMCLLIGLCTLIALLTDDVLILAEITGSYPGVMVQNVIPSLIAIFGRRQVSSAFLLSLS